MSRTQAAVLIPVFRAAGGDLWLVLVRRTDHGVYGAQLSLPGGKPEPGDADLAATALREAAEETGLDPARARIVAELEPVATRTTGFEVTPFVAAIARPPVWRPEEREVEEVVEAPLAYVSDPANHDEEIMDFPTWDEPRLSPYVRVGAHKLWGLTYRILAPVLPRLAAGEWRV